METGAAEDPTVASELLSTREACELLGRLAGVDRETARRVLRAGPAGRGTRLRGTVLHERGAVEALGRRPVIGGSPPWPGSSST